MHQKRQGGRRSVETQKDPVRPQRPAAYRLRGAGNDAPAAALAGADPGDGLRPFRLGSGGADVAAPLPARARGQPPHRTHRPARVAGLVLTCTAPGWPLTYPMPAASIRLITSTRRLPPEAARRRYIENALSARTVARNPGLVERLMDVQGGAPP